MIDPAASITTNPAVPVRRPARVDVLIPVFNAATTVESALRSILTQTLTDVRLIVVDDGSTDATPAILSRLADQDPRLHVVRTDNHGIVDALNLALALATAVLVARHDADDIAYPGRLETQVAYLDANPDCVAVGCNAFHIDGQGARIGHTTTFKSTVVGDPFFVPSKEPYLMHPFLLARRAAVVASGGYRHVFHAEDTDLYWRLAALGRLANVVDVLGEYRMHGESVSAKSVLNGRIAAVSSQRAAISERRRRMGAADLDFPKSTLATYRAAEGLGAIVELAAADLSVDEAIYLRLAAAAKLLELSSYRPYRMTSRDRATIRRYLEAHFGALTRTNRVWIVFRYILGPRRLLRNPREALGLIPWRVMPRAIVDLVGHLTRRRGVAPG